MLHVVNNCANRRSRRALGGAVDGLHIAAQAHMRYIYYVAYVHTPESRECTEDFTDSGNGCLGNLPRIR